MKKTYIIAEAGVNHNGSLELAKRLADIAKQAGADCVKYQTFIPENLVTETAQMAEYQKENMGKRSSQLEMLKGLSLSFEEFQKLKDYCDVIGITFISTPFDLDSIAFLNDMHLSFWKVPSGEITNYPYLKMIGKTRKPVVLSTGMSTLSEVDEAVAVLKSFGTEEITLLHCTTEYPAPFAEVNLKAMKTMQETFHLPVGYSDHTEGILAPLLAVGLGAVVIEKHFTLDKKMEGPDHRASLNPDELKEMIDQIRLADVMLRGSGAKERTVSEEKNIAIARKSIVAKNAIQKGELFSEANLTTKRPGDGLNPMFWEEVIGRPAKRDFPKDAFIEL